MDNTFTKIGFYPADILLPKEADMEKWAVVACDQFTSQPEYWEAVEEKVKDAPSTLRLILPEALLGSDKVSDNIADINKNMSEYISQNIFTELTDSLILVERTQSDGKVRTGIVGKIDLECYDFTPGNTSLIRATEGTVLSRIPPRVKVRENAPIELPHVMLLIDDPDKTVIEPLSAEKASMEKLYDFDLMQGGGHIVGYKLSDNMQSKLAEALLGLTKDSEIEKKYGIKKAAPLLFAVGDGNHSLATAKRCYEDQKAVTPKEKWTELPSRYALVEVVNNHDDALGFEPIHRVIFNVDATALLDAFLEYYPGSERAVGLTAKEVLESYKLSDNKLPDGAQLITYHFKGETGTLIVPNPELVLAVGTLQTFLDKYLEGKASEVDYIHGDEVVMDLSDKDGNLGFLLPAMGKEQLFKTVMADGVLPRKTFSMGHAQDKRYYIEARKIR